MNRLKSSQLSSADLSSASHSTFVNGSSSLAFPSIASRRRDRTATPPFSLFAPLHYERRYAYPLLVWLHGEGGSERELRQLMPHVSVRNYVAVAVRGGSAIGEVRRERMGRTYTWEQSPRATGEAAERVQQCIDVAQQRFNVHPERVFVAGNGRGGTMALRLALQYPEWFAGAVSLGGPMPTGNAPLGRVKSARGLPLMLASCRESDEYPPARVADDLRLLHAAGFSLALRQYPGEHELTTVMLADMDRWLMEQVCPSTANAAL
jgi:phospholipase/carboxylesterase